MVMPFEHMFEWHPGQVDSLAPVAARGFAVIDRGRWVPLPGPRSSTLRGPGAAMLLGRRGVVGKARALGRRVRWKGARSWRFRTAAARRPATTVGHRQFSIEAS